MSIKLSSIISSYDDGSYRVLEDTEDISRLKSVKYAVDGGDANEDCEAFAINSNNTKDITVLITNRFRSSSSGGSSDNGSITITTSDEPTTVTEPEPAQPEPEIKAQDVPEIITVPEPSPELPKTGAPMAVGLGLILAAGGLAIRRIKK